ncbi:MAG: type II secretion system F family protein [Planctomycetota bacterium]
MGLHPTRLDAPTAERDAPRRRAAPKPGRAETSAERKETAPSKASPTARAGRRLSTTQTLAMVRQMGNLLTAGVSLSRALTVLEREARQPAAKAIWAEVKSRVSDGESLASAMSRYPKTFPRVSIAMVQAGEAGGFLPAVLRQIAELMTRERELRSRVSSAMIYPAVLAVVAAGVVTFLLSWFIPRFSEIFDDFGRELPLLTRIVQGASDGVRGYGVFIAIALVLGVIAGKRAVASAEGRRVRDRLLAAAPAVGPVIRQFAQIRFLRMLGRLIGAGVPLLTALRVARQAVGNQLLADTLEDAVERVSDGEPLAKSLGICASLFPGDVVEMIGVAEESGRLETELVRMADEAEGELDRKLRSLVAFAEVGVLFAMSALIGVIVVGMLLPVFDLWEAVR